MFGRLPGTKRRLLRRTIFSVGGCGTEAALGREYTTGEMRFEAYGAGARPVPPGVPEV